MAIGILTTQADLNNRIGAVARDFFTLYNNAKALSGRLKLFNDGDLTALGFAPGDVTAIHNFEGFADLLTAVFDGTASLPEATNFLAQVSGVIGVGF